MRSMHVHPSGKPSFRGKGPAFRLGHFGRPAWAAEHGHHGGHGPDLTAARIVVVSVVAWNLAWKGASLWRAAKDGSKPWFVALLVSNTAGILDGVYIFGVSAARRRKAEEADRSAIGEPEQLGHPQET